MSQLKDQNDGKSHHSYASNNSKGSKKSGNSQQYASPSKSQTDINLEGLQDPNIIKDYKNGENRRSMSNVGRTSLIGEYISTTLPDKVLPSDIPLETTKSNIS